MAFAGNVILGEGRGGAVCDEMVRFGVWIEYQKRRGGLGDGAVGFEGSGSSGLVGE